MKFNKIAMIGSFTVQQLTTAQRTAITPDPSRLVYDTDTELLYVGDNSNNWVAVGVGGSGSFIGLTDTPGSYAGQGGRLVAVNGGETGLEFVAGVGTDELAKVSANDTTPGYLFQKIVSGSSVVTVTELNDGADEDLEIDVNISNIDHGGITGLGDDDHTQYALLGGRASGQTLRGGNGSGENLTLESTSDVTKGQVISLNELNVSSNKIVNVDTPTNDNDAANKAYVDGVAQGISIKAAVRVTTVSGDGNVTLSGGTTIDGVVLANNDRVLLQDQTDPIENGIWLVNTGGAWSRPSDFDTGDSASGAFTFAVEGTSHEGCGHVCISDSGSDVIDTDGLTFTQFSGAGQITAGDGINKTGNTLDVVVADFAGSGLEDDGSNNLQIGPKPIDATTTVTGKPSGTAFVATGAGTTSYSLPSIASEGVGTYYTFAKTGSGDVELLPDGSDVIADSTTGTLGGKIENTEATETWANITILAVATNLWVITGGSGTWVTS